MFHEALPPHPVSLRDHRRDRSILALAAALCGALSVAGLAAFAVATQLSTEHHDQALSQATTALTIANERLATSRDQLENTRHQLRLAQEKLSHLRRAHRPPHFPHSPAASDRHHANLTTITHTGLNCPTEDHCQVHREMLNAEAKSGTQRAGNARFVVNFEDGRAKGLKVYRVRAHSLLSRLGFQNGDRIDRINGQIANLKTMRRLATTYARGSAMTLDLELQRRGESRSKRIDIL